MQKQITSGTLEQLWLQSTALRTMHHMFNLSGLLAFYCFTSPMAGRTQLGLIASGLTMEPITSLWKYFEGTLKKHHNQRGENGSHSHLRACWQMCKISSFIWALILLLWLDRATESNWALGVTYVRWKVATPPLSSLPVWKCCSSAWKECSLSFPRSLWRQHYGIIRPSPKPIPF